MSPKDMAYTVLATHDIAVVKHGITIFIRAVTLKADGVHGNYIIG